MLLKFTGIIFISILYSISTPSFAQEYAYGDHEEDNISYTRPLPHENRSGKINTIIAALIRKFKGYNIGIAIRSLSNGRILYQQNAYINYIPASTLKLFTAVAALDYLGPHFTLDTQFLIEHTPKIEQGILKGNLYIQFSGDPNLTLAHLQRMISALKNHGIKKIQGNIVIDDTALDKLTWPRGRVQNDKISCFAAPVTATIINRNCFNLNVKPNKRQNKPAVITTNRNLGIIIDNHVVTQKYAPSALDIKPIQVSANNRYAVTGHLPLHVKPHSIAVALQRPNLASQKILRCLFTQNHIHYNQMIHGETPKNARVLITNHSPDLAHLIKHMLKKSDNLIADSLLKKLGEYYFDTQGSWNNGRRAVREILTKKTGIDFRQLSLVDGSGLSMDNRINAHAFIQLLSYVYLHAHYRDLLFEALPRAGLDGTLKHRLGNVSGRVHAKTGSMHGISGLAGYIETKAHHLLVFSILINDAKLGRNNQGAYRLLEDRICASLARIY